jgi:hypothetical protein
MAVATIGRLAEECLKLVSGGDIPLASSVSLNEMKISVGQACNTLLHIDYIKINGKTGETIPNGSVLGYYPDVVVESWKGKSRAKLPVKPIKLPRDMGVWSVWPSAYPDRETLPLQMGQWSLLQSQPMINDLLGQVGRETYGDYIVFTKDLTIPGETVTVDMRLVIMDISLYGDFDPLPILPEMEWQIKQQVVAMYSQEPVPDKAVDATAKERKNIPLNEQRQS